jgi:ferredoxin
MVDNVINLTEVEDCGWCAQCELVCPNGVISFPYEIVTEEP